MSIAHSFLAILAGFITILGLTGITTALLRRFAPSLVDVDAKQDRFAMSVNIGLSLIFSILGGYVTARYAEANPQTHAFMLAIAVLLLSAVSAVQMKNKQPIYYLLILTVIPPLAVVGGGILRLHQTGALRW